MDRDPSPLAPASVRRRVVAVAIGVLAAALWHGGVVWGARASWPPPEALDGISWPYWVDGLTLVFGLGLTLPAPRRSGLVVGRLREHWRGVLLVCGGPLALTALVYPLLDTGAFEGWSSSMWTISPLAQDLVFFGFVYRVLDAAWSGRVVARLPVEWPLFLTALIFAAWHIPNFVAMPPGFVAFQLLYVLLGALVIGLARQWTGSLVYGWITHTAANAIAWGVG